MRFARPFVIATIVSLLTAVTVSPTQALGCGPEAGIPLENGCHFTITGSDTAEPWDGFAVTNADDVPLWDFVASRELQAIGYPISQRWVDGPFTLQAFQKVILQWDPDRGRMNYYNTLDALANRFPQITLANVPPHQVLAKEPGADFATVKENHLALLDQNAKIKTRFLAEPDWLNLYGLPIRYEEREIDGNPEGLQLLRTQRTVFEVWNVPAPGTTVGQVQLQNTPDKVKRLDNVLIPESAKDPLPMYVDVSTFARAPDLTDDVSVSPRVQRAIDDRYWVVNGVTPVEQEAIRRLKILASSSEELFFHTLRNILVDEYFSDPAYSDLKILDIIINISKLPWIQDGLVDDELDTFQHVYDHATKVYRSLQLLYWVQDGTTPEEERALDVLYSLAESSQEFLTYVLEHLSIPGIHSGPTDRDRTAIQSLSKIASLPWVEAGLTNGYTEDEETLLDLLDRMLNADDDDPDEEPSLPFLQAIIDMPFLQSLDGPELPALDSLHRLQHGKFEHFKHIVATFATRGGITDQDAKIVTVLDEIIRYDPQLFDSFLSGHGYQFEERQITLPLTGKTNLGIIRLQPGTGHTMNILESVVRRVESIMTIPFPNRYIALLISDTAEPFGGWFYGTHITIRPYFEDADEYDESDLEGIIVHEVAHYFWNKRPAWIAEGGAGFVELRAGVESIEQWPDLSDSCPDTDIRDLVDDEWGCNFFLGARLLNDLYLALDEQTFHLGLRRLYQITQSKFGLDECGEEDPGLCYFRFAFTRETTPESAAAAWHIIAHWYFGQSTRAS